MFTPAAARREKVEGRKAWRAITRLGDRPFERAMVMKSSCRVANRSERSSRKYTAIDPAVRAREGRIMSWRLVAGFCEKGT